jgi:hypothetical protein
MFILRREMMEAASTRIARIVRTGVALVLCVIVVGGFAPGASTSASASAPASQPDARQRISMLTFHDAMRKLWEDHVTWTRLFIVSDLQNLPDLSANAQRLLQNQDDIGNAIKPYYGEEAGDQLAALLRDHILIAADVIEAVKSGDPNRIQQELARWYANADDIATFLHNANPRNWSFEEMQAMMHEHLDLTTNEVLDYFNGNYTASVSDYDQIHLQALEMADMLSDGIIRQFPQRFIPCQLP